MPPCDGETVYVGINTAGFACCFNEVTHDGVCSMQGPELSTVQMSGLRWWRVLDRPDSAKESPVADRRYNAKLILPDGTEKPSLIVYYPPTLTGEEVEDIGREILAVFSGTLCSDVEDEEGRGTTTEDMLDAGLLDADGVDLPDGAKNG
jgi:hypothetical protein